MGRKRTLYIGCGLTGAPEDFRQNVTRLQKTLRNHFDVLEFLGLPKPGEVRDPRDVVRFDLDKLLQAERMLGICDHNSTGLGFEIGTAYWHNKKTLLVAEEGRRISSFPEGLDQKGKHGLIHFRHYKNWSHITELAIEYLS